MTYWDQQAIDKIRRGYYSAVYFNRTKQILLVEKNLRTAVMQIFQKQEGSILCGVKEVRELFRVATGYYSKISNFKFQISNFQYSEWTDKSKELRIESLKDGDKLSAWQPVMHITGPYAYFAHLESLYLGILARRTLVATNVRRAVQSAHGKSVIFFADRFDHFLNQEGDGYAAKVGGASGVCTEAHATGFGQKPVGTIPHALISLYEGDTVAAADAFAKQFPHVNAIVLVDFENDCVKTSLEVAKKLGKKLWGVRIDTAENMVDRSLENQESGIMNNELGIKGKDFYGVNPELVRLVRKALDQEGFGYVKIVTSGGFNAERIKRFEEEKTSVDVYGVGSAMLKGNNDFTADIVLVDGKPMGKKGREWNPLRVV